MKQITLLFLLSTLLFVAGCDKEKIIQSTEIIRETVTDTLYQVDSVFVEDTTIIYSVDTIINTVYDTVFNTVYDTVMQAVVAADVHSAFTAMQAHSDVKVLEFIKTEFQIDGGWVFYLSPFMSYIANPSENVYDFSGYIDYWTQDWSAYYPLEYGWRMTYVSGDPSIPANWTIEDLPAISGSSIKIDTKRLRENLK